MRLRIALTVDLKRNRPESPEEPVRPDTEALVERAGNDEPNEMHIGFRAMPVEDSRRSYGAIDDPIGSSERASAARVRVAYDKKLRSKTPPWIRALGDESA